VPWTLERFLQERRFDDYQTRRLAGRFDLDAAKRALGEQVDVVGLTERFDESLLLLRSAIGERGVSFHYERRNTLDRGELIRFEDLSPEMQERVRGANRLDLALYDYACKEVFPRQVAAYPGDMATDLEAFRRTNRDFRPSRLRRRLVSPYRFLLKRYVEPVIHARYGRARPVLW
jgi:hypothetical protein